MARQSRIRLSEKIMLKQKVSAMVQFDETRPAGRKMVRKRGPMSLRAAGPNQHQCGPAVDIEAALQHQRLIGGDYRIGLRG
jgi:hypothetical protein